MTDRETVLETVENEYGNFKRDMLKHSAEKIYTESYRISFYYAVKSFFDDVTLDGEEYAALAKIGNGLLADLCDSYMSWEYASVTNHGDTHDFITDYIENVVQDCAELSTEEKVKQKVSREFGAFKRETTGKPSEEVFDGYLKISFFVAINDYIQKDELDGEQYTALANVKGNLTEGLWSKYKDWGFDINSPDDAYSFICEFIETVAPVQDEKAKEAEM